MKKSFKILYSAVLGLAAVACSSPEKMAEMAENVSVQCDPAVLEVVAGKIEATVSVTYPADYFHPKAILEVTPVIVYEGGEAKMAPFTYQGEDVQDNYKVVSSEGATVTEKVSFDYVPGMEKSYLELRGVVKYKKKAVEIPTKKVADGANTTYMLVCKDGKADYKADNYQEIINTDIVAYASPDGAEDLNAKLSDKRSETAEKAFGKVTKKHEVDAPVNVISVGEDWEGFKELVSESDIEDKDLIIRVLSMYSDPAVREKEIKNMSEVYNSLKKEILPELRRARFIANVEFTNYSNEELLALIDENIDILDEEALLRAASVVKDNADKVAIYKKAVEKYNSARAQYNLAVVYINSNDLANAKAELAKAAKDADWQNAMGVIALREGDNAAAAKYFAASGTATSKENAAVLDILNGKYADAAAKLASADNCCNKVLAYILTDQLDQASAAATCGCAKTSYLKAVIAARQGKADDVKKYIDAASKDSKLAERATKDIEFAQYR